MAMGAFFVAASRQIRMAAKSGRAAMTLGGDVGD
jgi:hypothetical protein